MLQCGGRAGGNRAVGVSEQEVLGDELGRLKRLGFTCLAECLLSVPKAYEDLTRPRRTLHVQDAGKRVYAVLRLRHKALFDASGQETWQWKGASRVQMDLEDGEGKKIRATAFGNVWPWKDVAQGDDVHVFGEVTEWNGHLQIKNGEPVAPRDRGRVVARYPGKRGQVKGELLADGVARALHRLEDGERLLLAQAGLREEEFSKSTGYASAAKLLEAIHAPANMDEAERARSLACRLSAEAVVRRASFAKVRKAEPASSIPIQKQRVTELVSALPYPLTEDQARAIDEIVKDLRSGYPMRRLLSGDVGTGKSLVFMVPAVAAHEAGAKVAILAPSQLVVAQIARELRGYFPGVPVCEVLSGGELSDGIAIGTTALLKSAEKAKCIFDVVVCDEQHKFSVGQKYGLVSDRTNVLEATATAIPRTLALVNFGGMDVSLLRQSPVAKRVRTRITTDADMARLRKFFDEVLRRKGQIAVIYPFVEKEAGANGGKNLATVTAAAERWEKSFPGRVGTLHGNMSSDEKKSVLDRLQAGQVDILISSIVIEVGVTLPSLKAMLIVHPERYGVSQIHQLRGRLSRKGGIGYLFLHVSNDLEKDARARLELLEECADGFTLAERDMDLRGFGDVDEAGDSQTGATRCLFFGVQLTHKEIDEASRRMSLS